MQMAMNLSQLRGRLETQLGNKTMFSLINTRLILQTGVDLIDLRPGDDLKVGSVLSALEKMGYGLKDNNGKGK